MEEATKKEGGDWEEKKFLKQRKRLEMNNQDVHVVMTLFTTSCAILYKNWSAILV